MTDFVGSIHRTLDHLLLAERVWLGRFAGGALEEGEMGPVGIRPPHPRSL